MATASAQPGGAGSARSRTTRLPRAARRTQLLDSARAVFVANGYHAAAMDDIAERAGVSKPVLYQHFPGKLELYLALLDESSQALVALVREALASTSDNEQRVSATMHAYFDFVADPSGAFQLVFESDLTNQPEVRDRVAATDDACAELVSHVIAADTGLDVDDALMLASALTGMAHTAARRWLRRRDPGARSTAADLVTTLAWRGIRGIPLAHPPA